MVFGELLNFKHKSPVEDNFSNIGYLRSENYISYEWLIHSFQYCS